MLAIINAELIMPDHLISDRTCNNGPIPEGYEGVTDLNFDDVGEIAGSKLSLDMA